MGVKYTGTPATGSKDLLTLGDITPGRLVLVTVVTGAELRPDVYGVLWVGGSVMPTNMGPNDIWLSSNGGALPEPAVVPSIVTSSLPAMTVNQPYTTTLSVTGTQPMSFSTTVLPAGLTLNTTTGMISGTPTASGAYSFTVTVTNAAGSDSQLLTGTVGASAPATVSVFGDTVPAALTTYTDGRVGMWVAHQFYATSAFPTGWKFLGARVYVPAGSAHIGKTGFIALKGNSSSPFIAGASPVLTELDTNGSKTAFSSALVAGWNDFLFSQEWDVFPGGGTLIGVQIGNGSDYLYNADLNPDSLKVAGVPNYLVLAESGASGVVSRSANSAVSPDGTWGTAARWYGIDIIVRAP